VRRAGRPQHGVVQWSVEKPFDFPILLKERPLTSTQAKEMIYDIFLKKVVPIRFFHAIAQEYTMTSKQHGENWWAMHNAFSGHIKRLPPPKAFRANVELGKLFHLGKREDLAHEGAV
jgi:hypothetical protein